MLWYVLLHNRKSVFVKIEFGKIFVDFNEFKFKLNGFIYVCTHGKKYRTTTFYLPSEHISMNVTIIQQTFIPKWITDCNVTKP